MASKRSKNLPVSQLRPSADFTWPPPDEELAQSFLTLQKTGSEAPDSQASEPAMVVAPVTDEPVTEARAIESTRPSEIAAEIAHLQALIEELTQTTE